MQYTQHIFVVLGYGIPTNILKDENYRRYLSVVFNNIYDTVIHKKIQTPMILFCGGKTDGHPPYKRTEGQEMIRLFRTLQNRPFVKQVTRSWRIVVENKSISTLENILYTQKLLKQRKIQHADITLFCEYTRKKRLVTLTRELLKDHHVRIVPVDFDVSPNRYRDPAWIAKKERYEVAYARWALDHPENFKKYHDLVQEKFTLLRAAKPSQQADVLWQWWEKSMIAFERDPYKFSTELRARSLPRAARRRRG